MTNYLRKVPLLRLLLPFLIGISTQIYFPLPAPIPLILFSSTLIPLIISYFLKVSFTNQWIFGFILQVVLFFGGLEIVDTHSIKQEKTTELLVNQSFVGIITEQPIEKAKSIMSVIELQSTKKDSTWKRISQKAVVYFQKNKFSENLDYGDKIIINGKFSLIENSKNPNEFDFKQYMSAKGIVLQSYLTENQWLLMNRNCGNIFFQYAYRWQKQLLEIYKKNGVTGREFAVSSALVLGYRNDIDEETNRIYSTSGAMHILSVSGFHVGVIFIMLNFLFAPLQRFRAGRFLIPFFTILALAFFALLSGASLSVVRSALMFSLFVIGNSIQRNTKTINTLSASAFITLLFFPHSILDVGFQLSYLAVASIVFFQPKIQKMYVPKTWLGTQIWSLLAVSTAAQIATFPISIYCFHQFPNYFFITNLLVIPISTGILYLGVALFLLGWLSPLAKILGFLLSKLTFFLNYTIATIDSLPFSVSLFHFNFTETVLVYALIISLSTYFLVRKFRWILFSLIVFSTFLGINTYQNYKAQTQHHFFIYNVKGNSAISFVSGKSNFCLIDSTIFVNRKKLNFATRNHWFNLQIKDSKICIFEDSLICNCLINNKLYIKKVNKNLLADFCGTKILIIKGKQNLEGDSTSKLKVNYLVLSQNTNVKIEDLKLFFEFQHLIIDASNSKSKREKWIVESRKNNIPCFDVVSKGVFGIDL